ncbi:hypothetical protein [Kutzneria sp. 744]|nr:hypothetical protein [Kutzneria sp. 744]
MQTVPLPQVSARPQPGQPMTGQPLTGPQAAQQPFQPHLGPMQPPAPVGRP